MMQVETEVEKQSGLVLREVTLTNLKVRSSKCFGPKTQEAVVTAVLGTKYNTALGCNCVRHS